MERKPLRFGAIDGGQYDSLEPSTIPKNGWKRVINLLPYNERLNLREGQRMISLNDPTVTDGTALIPVTNLRGHVNGQEYAILVAGKLGSWAFVDQYGLWDSTISALPSITVTIGDDEMPWTLRQYKGAVYACRRNAGLMRVEGTSWGPAGRPAPPDALELDDPYIAPPDVIPPAEPPASGNVRFRYTYYDADTGNEGNPSPEFQVLAWDGLGPYNLTNFAAPDGYYATHYRVYATKLDGGVFFPIGDAPVASTEFAIDFDDWFVDGAISFGSVALSLRNGMPPATSKCFEIWNERGWLSDGETLLYSAIQTIEGYSSIQNLPFDPNDNDSIQVLYAWGDYLVVAKRRSMVLLQGFDRTSFEQKLWTKNAGCIAPHSMKNCEGKLVWLGDAGFYSAGAGEDPTIISSKQVAEALATGDPERMDLAVADIIPDKQLYIFAYPKANSAAWGGLCLNWRTGSWTEFDFPSDPKFIFNGFDQKLLPRTLALVSSNAQVYGLFETGDDSGQVIVWSALSGAPDTGGGSLAGLASVSLLTAPSRYPVTVRAFRDGQPSIIRERTVRLNSEPGWKEVDISTMRRLGTQLQVEISGAHRGPFWIADMEWDILVTSMRRRTF